MVTFANRAKVGTSTTGTGAITLGSPAYGSQSFADAGISGGDTVRYVIEDGGDWEIGSGSLNGAGTQLNRNLDESSTGSKLNLSGNAFVFVSAAAEDIQQPPSEGPFVDGDKTKLDGIEAGADVTDTTNVTAAGALMDSEVTNLAQVKAFDSSDYATAAQGSTADSAVQPNDSPTFGSITVTGTVDGRDVAADGTKLDGIEAGANVTDTANVTAAGALMDSEVTNLAQVKAFDSSDYATAAQGSLADSALQSGDNISSLTNDAGYTTNVGDITGVTAGSGITGGGTSGTVTVNHADTSSQGSVNNSGATVIQDVTVDTYGHVTGLGSKTLTAADVGAITGNQTITLSGDLSGSGTTSINAQIGSGVVGATELNVSGNGSTSQFLRSDGDGSFTWATPTDTNTTYSAGTALDLSGTTFNVDLSELSTSTTNGDGDYFVVTDTSNVQRKLTKGNINISGFNNDAGYTNNVGDITGVTAGTDMTGGGTSGTVTINHADTSTLSGTYGSTADGTKIDQITVDARGHVTSITTGPTGDIQGVTAGAGLTGGGTGGTPTLSHADTSSQGSVNNSGATVIQDVTVDTYGHVTGLGSKTLTASDVGAITGNQTITLSGDLSGSGTTSINAQIASNAVGANELNVSGNGTSGQTLTSDGDGTFSWADAGGGGGHASIVFEESGTWTAPSNCKILVEAIGGGGSGGNLNINNQYQVEGVTQGGASGGYTRKTLTVTSGTTLTFSVGAGGAAVSNYYQYGQPHNTVLSTNNGGTTTVTGTGISLTANGGTGGKSQAKTSGTFALPDISGGTASGGDVNVTGTGVEGYATTLSGGASCLARLAAASNSGVLFSSGSEVSDFFHQTSTGSTDTAAPSLGKTLYNGAEPTGGVTRTTRVSGGVNFTVTGGTAGTLGGGGGACALVTTSTSARIARVNSPAGGDGCVIITILEVS